MGIPMVTMTGVTEVARLGTSMLNLIEHPEWIATNSDEYIKIACDIASDLNKLNQTRLELRQQVQNSPLMNGELAIQNLETAFRHIWKEYVEKAKIQIKVDS
jgi:predicted O-linked N-acetylglucosamine transferase (SPINDLY family)